MIRRFRDFSRWHIEEPLLTLMLPKPDASVDTIDVAATVLPTDHLNKDSICYCAGVGEEINLDRYLSEVVGAKVWAFDPTPRSIAFMTNADYDRSLLKFLAIGLWSTDTLQRFFAPKNPRHVSHSLVDTADADRFFDAPCRSIPSIMRELGHSRIDLLKLNIEGAEDVVLEASFEAGVFPTVITVTWEGGAAFSKAIRWTRQLSKLGYRFVGRRAWFFTYCRVQAG